MVDVYASRCGGVAGAPQWLLHGCCDLSRKLQWNEFMLRNAARCELCLLVCDPDPALLNKVHKDVCCDV